MTPAERKLALLHVGPLERGYRLGMRLGPPSPWRATCAWAALLGSAGLIVMWLAL